MPPDFLCIGAQKAGTTWLYRMLRRHPDLWLPPEKELHYFDEKMGLRQPLLAKIRGQQPADVRWRRQFTRQLRKYRQRSQLATLWGDLRWDLTYFFASPTPQWYASLFSPAAGRLSGEVTPNYASMPVERVAAVAEALPNAKVIYLLRNPIERSWSTAMMTLRMSDFPSGGDAVQKVIARSGEDKHNDYLGVLRTWSTVFPPERIFVGFTEDIAFAPEALLDKLHAFLGVRPRKHPAAARRTVHGSSNDTMPLEHARAIAQRQEPLLRSLSVGLGHYARWWHWLAQRLQDPDLDAALPYPLWRGPLFAEWTGGTQPDHARGDVFAAL